MEEIALTITHGLTRLIIPLGVGGIILALALMVTSLRRARPEGSSAAERVSVFLSALISLIGITALVTNALRKEAIPVVFSIAAAGLILLLAAPALLWRSQWRVPAEGLATIGLSVVAILSGFSIGYAFVPLLVLMVWVCIRHLRSGSVGPGHVSHPRSG